jgi:hypothetical protein
MSVPQIFIHVWALNAQWVKNNNKLTKQSWRALNLIIIKTNASKNSFNSGGVTREQKKTYGDGFGLCILCICVCLSEGEGGEYFFHD